MKRKYISIPGHQLGPCRVRCEHADCQKMRRDAQTACAVCGAQIGYERAYYDMEGEGLAHVECFKLSQESA